MRILVFGLTVTSSWGNGHATTWRGLLKELQRANHQVTFFEWDAPWYAAERDLPAPPYCDLVLYKSWSDVLPRARAALAQADVAIVTSFCPDGIAAGRLVLDSRAPVRAFYDIDTPRTLADLASHGAAAVGDVQYVDRELIREYDVFLSFTGGPTLRELEDRWGVKRAVPLYCSVDPEVHRPVAPVDRYACALGYLGSYSHDRQPTVERLLVEPARRNPAERFEAVMPGTPADVAWPPNVTFRPHLPPPEHAAFYSSNRITLNVTRQAMVQSGYAPSVRLFEASACGVPIVTDRWAGLDAFFEPGDEILTADTTDEALEALSLSDGELARIARAARERCLADHTAAKRAAELVAACEAASVSA